MGDSDQVEGCEVENILCVVTRDDAPNYRFMGRLVAEATSKTDSSQSKWETYRLWHTWKGSRVCQAMKFGEGVDGSFSSTTAELMSNDDYVIEFFGWGTLAKQLYALVGISTYTDIE